MKLFHTAPQTTSLKARPFLRSGAMAAGVLSMMLAALAPPAWSQAVVNQRPLLAQECAKRKAQLGLAGNPSTQTERDKAVRFDSGCNTLLQSYDSIMAVCDLTNDRIACLNKPETKAMADRVFNTTLANIRTLGG